MKITLISFPISAIHYLIFNFFYKPFSSLIFLPIQQTWHCQTHRQSSQYPKPNWFQNKWLKNSRGVIFPLSKNRFWEYLFGSQLQIPLLGWSEKQAATPAFPLSRVAFLTAAVCCSFTSRVLHLCPLSDAWIYFFCCCTITRTTGPS